MRSGVVKTFRWASQVATEVETLSQLNFHDSCIRDINLRFSSGNARECELVIDYYNWEANTDGQPWKWRKLIIKIGSLAHLEFSSPDVLNRAQDIHELELTTDYERFRAAHDKTLSECPGYKSPLFDTPQGPVALKFLTHNSDWLGDGGYILAIGSDVTLKWDDGDSLSGQIHIPAGSE